MDAKKLAVGAAAAAMLALGGGTALAAQNNATEATNDTNIKGTVAAPAEKGGEDEAAEAKRLEGMAKVDRAAAEKAALQTVPGTAKDAELGDENGYVVWEVEVQASDGTLKEVKVDAGNGQVLAQESEEDEGSEANEAAEGPEGSEANEAPEAGEATK